MIELPSRTYCRGEQGDRESSPQGLSPLGGQFPLFKPFVFSSFNRPLRAATFKEVTRVRGVVSLLYRLYKLLHRYLFNRKSTLLPIQQYIVELKQKNSELELMLEEQNQKYQEKIKELEDFVQLLYEENDQLKQENERLRRENEQLKQERNDLRVRLGCAQLGSQGGHSPKKRRPKVAIIGGHSSRRQVLEEFSDQFNFIPILLDGRRGNKDLIEQIRSAVTKADFVVVVTNYNSHDKFDVAVNECRKRGKRFVCISDLTVSSLGSALREAFKGEKG
jgi:regulator of replication initiation timing